MRNFPQFKKKIKIYLLVQIQVSVPYLTMTALVYSYTQSRYFCLAIYSFQSAFCQLVAIGEHLHLSTNLLDLFWHYLRLNLQASNFISSRTRFSVAPRPLPELVTPYTSPAGSVLAPPPQSPWYIHLNLLAIIFSSSCPRLSIAAKPCQNWLHLYKPCRISSSTRLHSCHKPFA